MRVGHIPDVICNDKGTPLISSMLAMTREQYAAPVYMIINTDIILWPGFVGSIRFIAEKAERYLIVGQRWDLEIKNEFDFSAGWEQALVERLNTDGRLHPRGGSDYFVFPAACYANIPDFTIGRAGWDNWMIYEARRQGWRVIDATQDIQIVHQNHDYRHLPDGKPHYRLPETFENVRLAGGSLAIFTLEDCNSILKDGKLKRPDWNWHKFWREVEIFPLVRVKSIPLAWLFFAIFHPIKAYREWRAWMKKSGPSS